MMQRVAKSEPDLAAARQLVERRVREFVHLPWWGPVTDAVGLAAGLTQETTKTNSGDKKTYFSFKTVRGPAIVLRAARLDYDAFVLAKHVVSSCIATERPIPLALRDFAALVLIDRFPVPKEARGVKRRAHWHRDVFFHALAKELEESFGLKRMENDERANGGPPSASSLIFDACKRSDIEELKHVSKNAIKAAVVQNRALEELNAAIESLGPWFEEYLSTSSIDHGDN